MRLHHTQKPIYLTAEAIEKHKRELKELEIEEKAVVERLTEAREKGDLSENGAYRAAKFELGSVRRRLGQIRRLLRKAQVAKKNSDMNMVSFGSKLRVKVGNTEKVLHLVSQYEADPISGKISVDSPLGAALLNQLVGSVVKFETPMGQNQVEILEILA